jgi:peptide chain release factor 1
LRPSTQGHFVISIIVSSKNLNNLEQEAGGLRLQRVPPTERKGRVHTSTVTIAVLDYKPMQSIEVKQEDCEITWFSGTGPGGQNRNKSMCSCRLKHKATGIVITAQTRSRQNSLNQAMIDLTKRVQAVSNSSISHATDDVRKSQVGSGMRGDKNRTIQFQHDTVVDHRTNKRITAEQFMKGNMDKLWQ